MLETPTLMPDRHNQALLSSFFCGSHSSQPALLTTCVLFDQNDDGKIVSISTVFNNNENGHTLSSLFLTASVHLVEGCIELQVTSALELSLRGVCIKND